MVLFICFAIILLVTLGLSLKYTITAIKNNVIKNDYKSLLTRLGIIGIAFSISVVAFAISIHVWNGNNPTIEEWLYLIIGGLFFAAFFYISLHSFLLHYYDKNTPELLDKWLFRTLAIAFPLAVLFVFIFSNGFTDYLTYPLIKGLNFSKGFVRPGDGYTPNLAFYALCILSGAVYVYFYCDHKFYIQYGKHGILESTFLVAFPAGIIGARLFYVIGVWDAEFAGRGIGAIFDLTQGGLTILGGAATGIVVGVLWFMWRNKGYSIWVAVDIIVPSILIAQAIGRWGNFFNCEVHGTLVSEEYWTWLPKVIYNNAHFSSTASSVPIDGGYLYAPLFFVEGIVNFLGFFVLAHLFGNKLRKYTEFGDLCFGYILWYGLTRVLMEPLRYSSYKMGTWSWFWSFVFIIVGSLLIVGNHVIRYIIRKRKNELKVKENAFKVGLIETVSVAFASLVLILVGSIMMANNPFVEEVILNGFNTGLILLVCGISLLLFIAVTLLKVIEGRKQCKNSIA